MVLLEDICHVRCNTERPLFFHVLDEIGNGILGLLSLNVHQTFRYKRCDIDLQYRKECGSGCERMCVRGDVREGVLGDVKGYLRERECEGICTTEGYVIRRDMKNMSTGVI